MLPSAGLTSISPPSTAAPTGPTTVASTTTSAPAPVPVPVPIPGPSAAAAGAGGANLKRPAAADLQRTAGASATPTKRQATSTSSQRVPVPNPGLSSSSSSHRQASATPTTTATQSHHLFQPQAVMSALPAVVTEDQLLGKTPEQLIATILQVQMQHQHCFARISAQYDTINQQLNDLRGALIASHQAAASALAPREPSTRPIVPPPAPPPAQQPAVPYPRGPPNIQTPSRPGRPPSSPSSSHAVQARPTAQTPQPAGPPQYDYRTVGTVEEVWREYRQGMDGQQSIEWLDATWGSRWRPEPRGRTWYSRRKVIWDKIKEYINEGMSEDEAVREVEKLRDNGTINKLIRMLQEERKDRGVGDDSMVG
ncbi:transcriptional activator of glycolytic enzymes-domain-containing protein [Xylariaceae sp. FL0662B]|nr:transcriptional activator of glycolytic enzymes-domain-containing protein [Xylariaceae sp. FL0662B]